MDINNREKNEDKKIYCRWTGINKKDCPRCVEIKEYYRVEISDDDFVDNPYGHGFEKKCVDEDTPKAKTKTKTKTNAESKTKIKASTSSVVADPNSSASDDDFVPCTFKTNCKK